MNSNLIASGIGALLAVSAIIPAPVDNTSQPLEANAQDASSDVLTLGNLQISTVPGNQWIQVTDYAYTPRIPPAIDLTGYPTGMPLQAVVWDTNAQCVGRITDESGQLRFIFVEADIAMCGGNLPQPASIQQNQTMEARG